MKILDFRNKNIYLVHLQNSFWSRVLGMGKNHLHEDVYRMRICLLVLMCQFHAAAPKKIAECLYCAIFLKKSR